MYFKFPQARPVMGWLCVCVLTACGGGGEAGSETALAEQDAVELASGSTEVWVTRAAGGAKAATATPTAAATTPANPVSRTKGFYINPYLKSWVWTQGNPNDYRTGTIRSYIAQKPAGVWFGGWETNIGTAVKGHVDRAAAAGTLPILVAYAIPQRDCGGLAAGGANSVSGYKAWVTAFAQAVGTRAALLILEPDALAQLSCLPSDADRATRISLLNFAVNEFAVKAPGTWVYLDAGNSAWVPAAQTADLLLKAGVAKAHGFSLNVSNYRSSAESTQYGQAVNAAMQAKGAALRPFVIDTGRNGNGPLGTAWCDPAGRRIGAPSQVLAIGGQPEMNLWVKPPGEVDGCAPSTGGFSADQAYKLALGL